MKRFAEDGVAKNAVALFAEDSPFLFRDRLTNKFQVSGPGALQVVAEEEQPLFSIGYNPVRLPKVSFVPAPRVFSPGCPPCPP